MAQPTYPPTAQQPAATSALQAPSVPVNQQALDRLGAMLEGRFKQYEWDRRMAELMWTRNARQFLGVYDPDIEQNMDRNRSKAYPKITRVKCVSMLSRLMNLLFPADDKNWSIEPSAVPELSQEDLQGILDTLYPPPPAGSDMTPVSAPAMPSDATAAAMPAAAPPQPAAAPLPPLDDEAIESAIRDFAKKRARRMELEIEDQLQELGGARTVSYTTLCRKVLASGIQYGAGILKGPFVEEQQARTWVRDEQGKVTAVNKTVYRPRFEFTSLWDYYPDMSAKNLHQMQGCFERVIMTRHQLNDLKQRPDFFEDQIELAFKQNPTGNYIRRAYETELFAIGPQINATAQGNTLSKNKYEAYVWEGFLTGRELQEAGNNIPDDKLTDDMRSEVWIINNVVIKAKLSPWTELKDSSDMPMYHHFIFEENETFLLGNGLPNIVRDSQLSLCAAVRMALDNASIQRNIEVNAALLSPNQDLTSIQPDKVWIRDDEDPARTGNMPAIKSIDLPMHLTEMQALVAMFQNFADQETFVGPATGGDMSKGPSEPFRTATGAAMLRGDAALPFKDVVRNFDIFTESVINAVLVFNKNFNTDPNVEGDFQPVARGATSLIAKEVLGSQLDQLAQSMTPEEKQYLKARNFLRARVRVRDLDVEDIVMNDKECDAVDAQTAQQAQATAAQAQQLAEAQIREILANALKNISQAGKNSAASEATTANVVLDALSKGLDPDSLTPQGMNNDGSSQAAAAPGAGQGQPAGGTGGPSAAMPAGPGIDSNEAAIGASLGQGAVQSDAMPA